MAHPVEDSTAYSGKTKLLSQLRTADDLSKKLDSLKRGRQSHENQWRLNLAFYKGRQYSYFNRASRRIESLPVEDGEKPRYRVRLVSNQIISGSHSLLAKYTKTRPRLAATPGSGSDSDLKASQMASALLEYWWDELSLDDKLEEALLWSIIAGQGYWKISWDGQAGKPMRFTLDPQGKPIVDDALKSLFEAQLRQYNVEPQEKVVYMGDLRIESISPFDVFCDPTARTFDECQYVFCQHNMTPDDVYSKWGVYVQPDAVSTAPDTTLPFANATDSIDPTVKRVNIGYFKPGPSLPKGRYVVWIDSPKQILEDGPWPYPSSALPIVKFPGLRIPGAVYDSSVIEHAIPLQKELNKTISQIVEYKNLTIKPRIWAPTGSIRTRLTTEPGALYEYTPIGDHRPEVEKLPSMPPYVFEHLQNIRDALRDVFSLTEVTEGTVPPNVEAGIAIDLLQEMATDRIAPTIRLMELAIGRAGHLMLSLAQKYYVEPRLLKIKGSGGGIQVKKFTQADINGEISVKCEAGSGLPKTRAGRQAQVLNLVDRQIIPADKAYKYLDMGDLKAIAMAMSADEDQALREHEKMIQGKIVNEISYQQMEMQLQSGQATGPDGQPITDPQQAQEALQNAGLQPLPYENYEQHMETHKLFMTSPDFEALPLEIKQRFVTHYQSTLQVFMSLPKPVEFQAVRPTLQIKTTAGPTAVADILNKAGILDVTPQTMTEPPLETWVSDSVDKPDAENVGNDHQATVQAAQGMQQINQADDLHLQKLRAESAKADKAQADAALSVRKARETKINKPSEPKKGK